MWKRGKRSRSNSSTETPCCERRVETVEPAGPPPMTTTSGFTFMGLHSSLPCGAADVVAPADVASLDTQVECVRPSARMARLRRFFRRISNVVRPDGAEADLARELASHLALLEDEFRRRGLTPDEARLAARRAFGGVEQTKDRHRDARSFVWLEDAGRDVRHAARLLRRDPLFA